MTEKPEEPGKKEESQQEFDPEPLDINNLEIPKPLAMVKFGLAAMWREVRRLVKKSEKTLLELQEQKLFGNYIEFFLKLHSTGILEEIQKGDNEAGPSEEDMMGMGQEELAALTLVAAKNLKMGVPSSMEVKPKVEETEK